MSSRMSGKVAVITGGGSGIGRATALMFISHGARVLIADRNIEAAEETIQLAANIGSAADVAFKQTDVTIENDIEAMIDDAVHRFGGIDCVFNNAGVAGALGGVTDTSADEWDRTFAVLLRSVFLGVKYGARAMIRQGRGGSIINTSSTSGLVGGSGPPAYSAAKAGIVNLSMNAAVEFAPHSIRVNAIAPGAIRTPLIPVNDDAEMLKFMNGRQPWPKAGQADDIAAGALYLASDDSRFCTGSTLLLDGGLLAWGPGLYPHAQMSYS